MSGLLPIIRRVRRPLLPPQVTTDAKPAAEPVKVQAAPTAVAVSAEKSSDSQAGRQVGPNKISDAKSSSALEA
jgi:hypothetical protein